jgi:hypothetical protein
MATAQDIKFDIKKTGMFKDKEELSDIVAVGSDGKNGIIMARSYDAYFGKKHGYVFEHYSDKMIKLKSYDYPMKEDNHLVGVVIEQNIINMIEFTYDKEQKAYICYAKSGAAKDFKFVRKELFRLNMKKAKTKFKDASIFTSGPQACTYATLTFNRDQSAFAISIDINTGRGKDKDEVHDVYVFNRKFDLLMKNSLDKDFKNDAYKVEDIEVADDGNTVYILGKIKQQKKDKETGLDYHYDVNKITNNGIKTQVFDTGQHDANRLHIVSKKDELVCLGLYSGLKEWRVEGIAYFNFDANSFQLKGDKYLSFPEEVYSYYGEKADRELQKYGMSYPSLAENGEIFLNTEKHDQKPIVHSTGETRYTKTEYQYKDILTAKITEKGDIAWVKIVDKFQFTRGALIYYISYKTVVMGNDIYYFVNGNLKKGEDGKDLIDYGKLPFADLNIVKIDTDGNVTLVKALDNSQIKAPFKVIYGEGLPGSSSIFFLGKEVKNKQLIKVTL